MGLTWVVAGRQGILIPTGHLIATLIYRIIGYFSGNLILALLAVVLEALKIINANKTFKISMN
jgi:hypothetical protein